MTATETTTREDAVAALGAAFKGVTTAVRRLRGRDTHRPGELSYAQYHLLFGLSEQERSTGELAQATELAPATVTQMLDHLVTSGLVGRTRSETDRRIVTCALTEKGRAAIEERRRHIEGCWNAALTEFSDAELATAASVLDRIRTMLDNLTEPPAPTPA